MSTQHCNLDDCLIVVYAPDVAIALHHELRALGDLPPELCALRRDLNDYTGLDDVAQ